VRVPSRSATTAPTIVDVAAIQVAQARLASQASLDSPVAPGCQLMISNP